MKNSELRQKEALKLFRYNDDFTCLVVQHITLKILLKKSD